MNNSSRVVLITGALTGIGNATAFAFARKEAGVDFTGQSIAVDGGHMTQ